MDRSSLPFRQVTEGYFVDHEKMIFARDTGKGYLELPGGGVDAGETAVLALHREAFEEAGVVALEEETVLVKTLVTRWDPSWPTTEKQRKRYEQFQGEEISFFVGKVKDVVEPTGDLLTGEPGWEHPVRMTILQAIAIVEAGKPFHSAIAPYRETQLEILRSLL
jgi:8-oxo-dGTP pyrophosphatase MutT (NUDIX family)